jgi:hypothetical protein
MCIRALFSETIEGFKDLKEVELVKAGLKNSATIY